VFTSSDKGIHSPTEAPESPTIKSKHSRSRGGCARCKRRRQKCDEQKPSCSRCKIEGIRECTYTMTLQWGGREFGHFKSYARNSDIKKCGEWYCRCCFGNQIDMVVETEPGTFVYVSTSKRKSRSPPPNDRLSRSLSPLDSSTPTEQLLLHHFANSASRITSCHPRIQTSFCNLLLPMAVLCAPLLSALMALSAIHRNSLYTPSPPPLNQPPNEIIVLKASSVAQLRSELLLPTQQRSQMQDAILATALTLCMCEIHSGGDQPRSWRLHLEGAKAILSTYQQMSTNSASSDPNSQSNLLKRWYTSIEALAATTSRGIRAGQLPLLPPSVEPPKIGTEDEAFLDDYFGFSTDLVDAFKEIGAAAWERRSLATNNSSPSAESSAHVLLSEGDLQTEAEILEKSVEDMIARDATTLPKFYPSVKESLDDDAVEEFYACNRAYQHTALLYIYRRIRQLPRTNEKVQIAVKNILECVASIKPRSGLSPYIVLTMPLFTAGREALGEDREIVRYALRDLGNSLKLRNVWRSLEFLEAEWESGNEIQGTS
jgi:hypothetical protein